jgi:hypothetical protein
MDPHSRHDVMLAPAATPSGYALHMPAPRHEAQRCPGVDEHLVVPERTRDEVVRGRRLVAFPANPPHADQQGKLEFLVEGNVVDDYVSSVELLTRTGPGSNFAADVSVRRKGIDPTTNTRYLEELAFEVVSEQSLRDITVRAEDLSNRGVRRVIAIFVKLREVREWDREHNRWRTLPLDGDFRDPTLVRPFKVRALLDSRLGANAVARGLEAKDNEEIRAMKALQLERGRAEGISQGRAEGLSQGRAEGLTQGRAEGISQGRAEGLERGRAEGLAQSILLLLDLRGLSPTDLQRETITTIADAGQLARWLAATNHVASVAELLTLE